MTRRKSIPQTPSPQRKPRPPHWQPFHSFWAGIGPFQHWWEAVIDGAIRLFYFALFYFVVLWALRLIFAWTGLRPAG
jgi:hypothetical protein